MHEFIHADALRQRGIDIHRFPGDTAALFGAADEMQCTHIVQAVRKLDQKNPNIIGYSEQSAQIFGSALILRLRLDF